MDVFAYVTSEPAFAVGVTELVYDARMFWKYRAQTVSKISLALVRRAFKSRTWEDSPNALTDYPTHGITLTLIHI